MIQDVPASCGERDFKNWEVGEREGIQVSRFLVFPIFYRDLMRKDAVIWNRQREKSPGFIRNIRMICG